MSSPVALLRPRTVRAAQAPLRPPRPRRPGRGPPPQPPPPPPRPGSVPRPPLVRRLLAGAASAVAVLVAPAGYGKTTLLAEWEASDPRPFVWLDPARLLDELPRP